MLVIQALDIQPFPIDEILDAKRCRRCAAWPRSTLPLNCRAGLLRAIVHLGIAAKLPAAQGHRGVLRDVGLNRRQFDAG